MPDTIYKIVSLSGPEMSDDEDFNKWIELKGLARNDSAVDIRPIRGNKYYKNKEWQLDQLVGKIKEVISKASYNEKNIFIFCHMELETYDKLKEEIKKAFENITVEKYSLGNPGAIGKLIKGDITKYSLVQLKNELQQIIKRNSLKLIRKHKSQFLIPILAYYIHCSTEPAETQNFVQYLNSDEMNLNSFQYQLDELNYNIQLLKTPESSINYLTELYEKMELHEQQGKNIEKLNKLICEFSNRLDSIIKDAESDSNINEAE